MTYRAHASGRPQGRPLSGDWLTVADCLAGGTNHRRALVALVQAEGESKKHTNRKVMCAILGMIDVGLVEARSTGGGWDLTPEGWKLYEAAIEEEAEPCG